MIIHAEDVFIAKRTYDAAVDAMKNKKIPRDHDAALQVQNHKRAIKKAVDDSEYKVTFTDMDKL